MEDILPTVRLTEEQVWNDYHEVLAANGWTVEAFEAIDDAGCPCCYGLAGNCDRNHPTIPGRIAHKVQAN